MPPPAACSSFCAITCSFCNALYIEQHTRTMRACSSHSQAVASGRACRAVRPNGWLLRGKDSASISRLIIAWCSGASERVPAAAKPAPGRRRQWHAAAGVPATGTHASTDEQQQQHASSTTASSSQWRKQRSSQGHQQHRRSGDSSRHTRQPLPAATTAPHPDALPDQLLNAKICTAQSLEQLAEVLQGVHGPLNYIHVTAVLVRLAAMAETLHVGSLRHVRAAYTLPPATGASSGTSSVAGGSSSRRGGVGHAATAAASAAGSNLVDEGGKEEGAEEGVRGLEEQITFELDAPFPVDPAALLGVPQGSGGADGSTAAAAQCGPVHSSDGGRQGAAAGSGGPRGSKAGRRQQQEHPRWLKGTRAQALRQVLAHALAMLEPLLPELDARGVVNSLHAMARLRMARHPVAVELVARAPALMEEFNSQGFSNLLWAAARLKTRLPAPWLTSFITASLPLLPRFEPQALCSTLWGLARVGQLPVPAAQGASKEWERVAYAALVRLLRADACTPQAIASTCWSLARLRLFPPSYVVEALAGAALQHASELTPQGAANTLWGLARLRANLSDAWWHGFMQATRAQLPEYDAVVLSTLLYSMALLGKSPSATTTATTTTTTAAATTTTVQSPSSSNGTSPAAASPALTSPSLAARPATRGSNGTGRAMPGVGAGAGVRAALAASNGHAPHLQQQHQHQQGEGKGEEGSPEARDMAAWGQELQSRLAHVLPTCTPMVASVVAYSLGKLLLTPDPPLLQALLARSEQLMGVYLPQGLTNTLWALARLEVQPPASWMARYLEVSYVVLPIMSQQELSNLIVALAKLRCWPDRLWMSRYDQQASALMHTFTPTSVSLTLRALVLLRYAPSRALQRALCRQVDAHHRMFKPMQLADTFWAASELGLPLRRDLLSAMAAGITEQLGMVAAHELVASTYAMVRLGLPLPPALLDLTLLETEAEMSRLSLRDLSGLVWALACVGYRPEGGWLGRLDEAAAGLLDRHAVKQQQQSQSVQGEKQSAARSGGGGGGDGEEEMLGADMVMERGHGGVGVRLEQQSGSLQTCMMVEAACRLVSSRAVLGPMPSPRLAHAVLSFLLQPAVLPLVTAPQVLLAVEGLARVGHVGGRDAILQALTAPVMQRSGLPAGGDGGAGKGQGAPTRRAAPPRLAVPLT